jgi:hypothetical protein
VRREAPLGAPPEAIITLGPHEFCFFTGKFVDLEKSLLYFVAAPWVALKGRWKRALKKLLGRCG